MDSRHHVLFLATLALIAMLVLPSSTSASCNPNNCRLPDCRCWDDPTRPGNFSNTGTPQIIAITFSQAINNHTLKKYLPLFKDLWNPNRCPARGTFFAQYLNTDEISLKSLYTDGHELALTSSDGAIPHDRRGWVESLFKSSERLYDAGIPRDRIRGARAPSLSVGGNDELQAEMQFGMTYEASCVLALEPSPYAKNGLTEMLWPYTYDHPENIPQCLLGRSPNKTFPGMWQFLIPEMKLHGHTCTTLSSCSPYIKTQADAFTLLYNTFENHFYKGRAPLTLNIDAQWLSDDKQVEGLVEFLGVVSRFKETWLITMSQALEWVRDPVPMYPTVKFMPWECPEAQKRPLNTRHDRR